MWVRVLLGSLGGVTQLVRVPDLKSPEVVGSSPTSPIGAGKVVDSFGLENRRSRGRVIATLICLTPFVFSDH